MKYCIECGKPNQDENKFCGACGKKFVIPDHPSQFSDNVVAGDVDMSTVTNIVNNFGNGNASSDVVDINTRLKRVFIFLEDGDWNNASLYCEMVLEQDPENARAYLGRLMIDLKVRRKENLDSYKEPFDNNNNYKRAIRFGDEKLVSFLQKQAEAVRLNCETAKRVNDSISSQSTQNMAMVSQEEKELLDKAFAHKYFWIKDELEINKLVVQASKCTGEKNVPYDIDAVIGYARMSLLQIACVHFDLEAVKYLIKLGIDVNYRNSNNITGLFAIAHGILPPQKQNEAIEIAKILLDNGADYNVVGANKEPLYNNKTDPRIAKLIKEKYPNAEMGKLPWYFF